MAFFRKKSITSLRPAPSAPLDIHLMLGDGSFDGDGDETIEYEGYFPHLDRACTEPMPYGELCPGEPAVFYSNVAGVTYRPGELQFGCFDLGSTVALVPEPSNQHDPYAIQVVGTLGKTLHPAGYVPAILAKQLAGVARGTTGQAGVVQIYSKSGSRIGLRIVGSFGRLLNIQSV